MLKRSGCQLGPWALVSPRHRPGRGGGRVELSCTGHLFAVSAATGRGHVAGLRSRMPTSGFHELRPEGCGVLTSH